MSDLADLTQRERDRRDVVVQSILVMVIASLVLVILGVFMVFSATAPASIRLVDSDPTQQLFSVAIRQALWAGVGVIGALVLAATGYTLIKKFAWVFFGIGLVLQALVLLIGGEGVGGNNNWISIGPASLQPSEFLKLAMIIWLGLMLSRLSLGEIENVKTLAIPAIGFVSALGLVVGGGDVGTGLIYVLIGVGMFWLAGMKMRHLIVPAAVGFLLAGVLVAIRPSRLNRVWDYFQNLFVMPDIHAPTQADYALFAFGSGGVAGVGVGAGKEKWRDLSEAHTDFIFAVIGEELGFFGVLTVIALFIALGWAIIRICLYHPDRYCQLVTAGAGLWLCGQAFANMWVVAGLLPVFGVPLPFVSMGGSSMMATLFMVGVVVSCALGVPGVKESFRVRTNLAQGARALIRRK